LFSSGTKSLNCGLALHEEVLLPKFGYHYVEIELLGFLNSRLLCLLQKGGKQSLPFLLATWGLDMSPSANEENRQSPCHHRSYNPANK